MEEIKSVVVVDDGIAPKDMYSWFNGATSLESCDLKKLDEKFHEYLEGAQKAGLPIGIYLFVYDNTEDELRSSLDQMFAELGDTRLDLPIAFDWENFMNYQDYEISFQKLNHLYDIFETEVERRGYESMLYGSKTPDPAGLTVSMEMLIWISYTAVNAVVNSLFHSLEEFLI